MKGRPALREALPPQDATPRDQRPPKQRQRHEGKIVRFARVWHLLDTSSGHDTLGVADVSWRRLGRIFFQRIPEA